MLFRLRFKGWLSSIDINAPRAYKAGMTFNKHTLPDIYLEPPVPAPTPYAEETWPRNWSLYFIARNWDGPRHGVLTELAKWVGQVDPSGKAVTKQRVQSILGAVAWSLSGYSDSELGIEAGPVREIIE